MHACRLLFPATGAFCVLLLAWTLRVTSGLEPQTSIPERTTSAALPPPNPPDPDTPFDTDLFPLALDVREATSDLPARLARCPRPDATEAEREIGGLLLDHWAATDAAAAARWALAQAAGPARQSAIDRVATAWAEIDLAAAIDWTSHLPEGPERHGALRAIAYEAARFDPVSSLSLAIELPSSEERDDLLVHAAAQCGALSPRSAFELAREFPDLLLRDRLLGAIVTAWADRQPAEAAAMLDAIVTPRVQDDTAVAIAQRWAQSDLLPARHWMANRRPGLFHDAKTAAFDGVTPRR